MKKFLIAILSLFLFSPSFALIKINEGAVRNVVESRVDAAHRTNVLTAWVALAEQNGGGLIGSDMWLICEKAGWNIRQSAGKSKCQAFVSDLLSRASVQGWAVCDTDEVNKLKQKYGNDVQTYCYKDTFKNVSVGKREAEKLAQAFVYNVSKDKNIVCSDVQRNQRKMLVASDDYLQCVSGDKKAFYEFKFDSVTSTGDSKVRNNLLEAVCKNIHGLDFQKSGHSAGGGYVFSWPDYCKTADATKCSQVNESLKFFGFSSSLQPSGGATICAIDVGAVYRPNELNKVSGLDNFAFCSGEQVNANNTLDRQVLAYVERTLGKKVNSFSCDGTPKRYAGSGCHDSRDDIMTCYIDGVAHDFVFDDLSELFKYESNAGYQAIDCKLMGGVYDGEVCGMLTEQQCSDVAALNITNCPQCKQAKWNSDKKICELPAAAFAKGMNTATRVTATVAGATVAIVLAVPSGGSSVVFWATTVGATATLLAEGADIKMEYDQDKYMLEMNRLVASGTPEEIEKFLRENLEKMIGMDSLDVESRAGLDEMIARVLQNAPDSYFAEIVDNCTVQDVGQCDDNGDQVECVEVGSIDKTLSTCSLNPKNGKNGWQTFKNSADTVAFVAGLVAIVASLTQFVRSTQTVTERIDDVAQVVDDLKTNGWIRQGNRWYNQSTQQYADKLPAGEIGWNPSANLRGGGRWYTNRGTGLGRSSGSKFIGNIEDYIRQNNIVRNVTRTVTSTVWNPNWLGAGAGGLVMGGGAGAKNLADVPLQAQTTGATPGSTPGGGVVPGPGGGNDDNNAGTPPGDDGAGKREDTSGDKNQGAAPVPVTTNIEYGKSNTALPVPEKKKGLSGLAAAAIGVAGAGAVVGGALLIGNAMDKDDDKSATNNQQAAMNYNNLMAVAAGTLGAIAGNAVSLVSLETVYGNNSPVALVAGRAVVVVKWNGMTIPFMMGDTDGWRAFKSIDISKDEFVELTSGDYSKLPQEIGAIRDLLNKQLPASLIKYYSSPNSDGLMLPGLSIKAYSVINNNPANGGIFYET